MENLQGTIEEQDPEDDKDFYSPTEPVEKNLRSQQPTKRSFEAVFDRPPFVGTQDIPLFHPNKQRKLDPSTKQQLTETKVRTTGGPKTQWLKDNNLNEQSRPIDFFEAFLTKEILDDWTSYTNTRAIMEGAGKIGRKKKKNRIYPDFVPFDIEELKQHIGVRILHGISPSPRLKMKFRSHKDDEVNGNDFVYRNLGPNAARRHKHFRRFFCVQDPTLPKPDQEKRPNWKIEAWFEHIQRVSQAAWECGVEISVDEQTLKFQGHHIHKLRITYKKEGDGFQCDALCSDGYTFAFYFRNQPPPEKYVHQGLSPLHARVMALFDSLEDKFHRCGMDNLYTSGRFCKAGYCHPKKVLIHGVARKSGRGIPSSVLQDEVQNRNLQAQVRGTVKAAQLVGDPAIPNLLAVSVYDTKPVHFFSTRCEKVKWEVKEQKVWDKKKMGQSQSSFLDSTSWTNIIMAWAMWTSQTNCAVFIAWTTGYIILSGGMQCFGGGFKYYL